MREKHMGEMEKAPALYISDDAARIDGRGHAFSGLTHNAARSSQ